jgi:hypothetical protein
MEVNNRIKIIILLILSIILIPILRYLFIFIGFFLFGTSDSSLMFNKWYYLLPIVIQVILTFLLFKKLSFSFKLLISFIIILIYFIGFFGIFSGILEFMNLDS